MPALVQLCLAISKFPAPLKSPAQTSAEVTVVMTQGLNLSGNHAYPAKWVSASGLLIARWDFFLFTNRSFWTGTSGNGFLLIHFRNKRSGGIYLKAQMCPVVQPDGIPGGMCLATTFPWHVEFPYFQLACRNNIWSGKGVWFGPTTSKQIKLDTVTALLALSSGQSTPAAHIDLCLQPWAILVSSSDFRILTRWTHKKDFLSSSADHHSSL